MKESIVIVTNERGEHLAGAFLDGPYRYWQAVDLNSYSPKLVLWTKEDRSDEVVVPLEAVGSRSWDEVQLASAKAALLVGHRRKTNRPRKAR